MMKKTRKVKLFSWSTYAKFAWSDCVLKAKARKNQLEKLFDELAKQNATHQRLPLINIELEIIDDYFDYLQINYN